MELSASEARLIEAATVRARAHQQKTAQERSEPHPDDDVTVRTGLYVVLEKSAGGTSAAALVDLFAEYFGVQMLAGTFAGAAEIASVYSAGFVDIAATHFPPAADGSCNLARLAEVVGDFPADAALPSFIVPESLGGIEWMEAVAANPRASEQSRTWAAGLGVLGRARRATIAALADSRNLYARAGVFDAIDAIVASVQAGYAANKTLKGAQYTYTYEPPPIDMVASLLKDLAESIGGIANGVTDEIATALRAESVHMLASPDFSPQHLANARARDLWSKFHPPTGTTMHSAGLGFVAPTDPYTFDWFPWMPTDLPEISAVSPPAYPGVRFLDGMRRMMIGSVVNDENPAAPAETYTWGAVDANIRSRQGPLSPSDINFVDMHPGFYGPYIPTHARASGNLFWMRAHISGLWEDAPMPHFLFAPLGEHLEYLINLARGVENGLATVLADPVTFDGSYAGDYVALATKIAEAGARIDTALETVASSARAWLARTAAGGTGPWPFPEPPVDEYAVSVAGTTGCVWVNDYGAKSSASGNSVNLIPTQKIRWCDGGSGALAYLIDRVIGEPADVSRSAAVGATVCLSWFGRSHCVDAWMRNNKGTLSSRPGATYDYVYRNIIAIAESAILPSLQRSKRATEAGARRTTSTGAATSASDTWGYLLLAVVVGFAGLWAVLLFVRAKSAPDAVVYAGAVALAGSVPAAVVVERRVPADDRA